MSKFIAVLSVLVAFSLATPGEASATDCTEEYMQCIAEAGLLPEPYRTMADVECGAAYTGCIVKKLRWW
jgi:hypothetical protein